MLRRAVVLGSACVALAACQAPAKTTVPVSDVQKDAMAICGYLPLAQVVAAIVAKHSANLDSVFAIATAICGSVQPKPATMTALFSARAVSGPPKVDGVVIRGKFVRR